MNSFNYQKNFKKKDTINKIKGQMTIDENVCNI